MFCFRMWEEGMEDYVGEEGMEDDVGEEGMEDDVGRREWRIMWGGGNGG